MKKLAIMFISAFLFAGPIGAEVVSAIDALNAEVDQVLQYFRNDSTQAALQFKSIQTNAERALSLKLDALYKKTGTINTVEIRLDNLEYIYGDGTSPTTNVKGFIGVDITKLVSQQELNRIVPEVESFIQSFAAGYTRQYGEAATVEAVISDKGQDKQGNYISIKGQISVKLDLTKLPQSIKLEDVFLREATAALEVDLTKGLSVDVKIVSNPAYKAFQPGQDGLKEGLDKLLAKDPETIKEIGKLFTDLDQGAGRIVNGVN